MTYDPNRDLFGDFKNPDGTYDGLKMMSQMTGLPEEEVKRIWEEAKNARKEDRRIR